MGTPSNHKVTVRGPTGVFTASVCEGCVEAFKGMTAGSEWHICDYPDSYDDCACIGKHLDV